MNRKTWTAVFGCERSSVRNWTIKSAHEPAVEITLLGADLDDRLVAHGAEQVTIDWLASSATVELTSGSDLFRVDAGTVLVHEPLPTLYRALPLATFDSRARRFWQRVFLLARLPGGRMLLRVLARRARA
jgi:hypothetical protein